MKTGRNENGRTLTRRGFGRIVAISPLAAAGVAAPGAIAQTRPTTASEAPQPVAAQGAPSAADRLRAATADRLASAAEIAKFDLPVAAEPAFVFRP